MSDVEATLRLVLEVNAEEANDLTPIQRPLLGDLMHQANECILFVRDYSNQSYCTFRFLKCGFWLSLICRLPVKTVGKALVKNYDSIIADYIEALHGLTEQFNNSEQRDIQVVVHRLESKVQGIGKFKLIAYDLHYLNSTSRTQDRLSEAWPTGDY